MGRPKKNQSQTEAVKGKFWKGTIPADIADQIEGIALVEERSFTVTLFRLLKEALASKGKHAPLPPEITVGNDKTTPLPIGGGSQPPRRIAAMAAAGRGKAPVNPEIAKIISEEEGWEGSPPGPHYKDNA
jgi:hypothetical protein